MIHRAGVRNWYPENRDVAVCVLAGFAHLLRASVWEQGQTPKSQLLLELHDTGSQSFWMKDLTSTPPIKFDSGERHITHVLLKYILCFANFPSDSRHLLVQRWQFKFAV